MRLTGLGAIACAALVAVACGGGARDEQSNDADRTVGTSGVATEDSADDARIGGAQADNDARRFIERAAMGGHAEVELGKLAAERAQSPEVKQFAEMMVRDHTKANEELKQAAARENVTLPAPKLDEDHQELMTKLRGLQGAEFDREYMRAMVDGHEDMKDLLDDRADRGGAVARDDRPGVTGTSGSTASAVNQWASKTLPSVEQHLQRAEQIASNLQDGGANQRGTTGTTGARPGTGTPSTGGSDRPAPAPGR